MFEADDLGCAPDEDNHRWAWDELLRQQVCARCGILEAWVAQERVNQAARRMLET